MRSRFFVSCCCNTIPWQGHEFSEEFLNVQGNIWAFLEYLCGQQKVLDHVVFEVPNLSWFYVLRASDSMKVKGMCSLVYKESVYFNVHQGGFSLSCNF